jgi:hypothetical protein
MKIRVSKRGRTVSVRFTAEKGGRDGADLMDALLEGAKSKSTDIVHSLLDGLQKRGYEGTITKQSPNAAEFAVSKPEDGK